MPALEPPRDRVYDRHGDPHLSMRPDVYARPPPHPFYPQHAYAHPPPHPPYRDDGMYPPNIAYQPWPSEFVPGRPPAAALQPPPPPPAHKVWILDCRTCRTFLTNHGMKAVLLLHPHVPLFSTDALPINCSAHPASPAPAHVPATSTDPPRTCECLTQTLCCHGCGQGVGYMIVIPVRPPFAPRIARITPTAAQCPRCTSSMSAANRATNGHRFVFHSSEITASERHYIEHEPGVLPIYAAPPPPSDRPAPLPLPLSPHVSFLSTSPSLASTFSSPDPVTYYIPDPPSPTSSISSSDLPALLPPSPSSSAGSPRSPRTSHRRNRPLSRTHDEFHPHARGGHPLERAAYAHPGPERGRPYDEAGLEASKQLVRPLRAGEVLHWHHLSRVGEISGVREDRRARGRRGMMYDR
ncbi:hypothetical protein OF83DRAFT_1269453 [Amylostereum chailletii]|nr:hypothetical protein OF83DRAFT_1269453 [Amylostereum chailletii]